MNNKSLGFKLFREYFVDHTDALISDLARFCKVDCSIAVGWLIGDVKPTALQRFSIETWTRGCVAAYQWSI